MNPIVFFAGLLLLSAALSGVLAQIAHVPPPDARRLRYSSNGVREHAAGNALRRVYHARGLLVSPPLVLAVFTFSHETEAPWLVWPLAGAFVGLGIALRVWAQQHIRFRLGTGRHLTTTGPYALVRNPLYIANTLICIGATVASELLWLVPITVLWCLIVYALVIRQEEARLVAKYGSPYREYCKAVARWVPHTLSFRALGNASDHFAASLCVEAPCILVLVPFVLKEAVST